MYFPSIHSYKNTKADGEMLIVHNGNGSNCIVSIPIRSKLPTTSGEKTLTTILDNVISGIPNKNESTSLNISNFNISSLVPLNVPYYFYQGQLVFEPCTQNYNYIVLDKSDYSINIDPSVIKNITNVFKQSSGAVAPPKNLKILSYNKNGASNVELEGDNDIYIECKPVQTMGIDDLVGEATEASSLSTLSNDIKNDSTSRMSFEELSKNPAFDVIVSFVGMFIIYVGGKYALSYIRSRRQ